jgi:hypothetical protein
MRWFLALLLALGLSLSPPAMRAAEAREAMPAGGHHAAAATSMDHCADEPAKQHDKKKADMGDCCVAACAGISIAPAMPADPLPYSALASRPAPERFRAGFLGEVATPPPRSS